MASFDFSDYPRTYKGIATDFVEGTAHVSPDGVIESVIISGWQGRNRAVVTVDLTDEFGKNLLEWLYSDCRDLLNAATDQARYGAITYDREIARAGIGYARAAE